MICAVCGQDYGLAHNCAGAGAAYITPEESAPFPTRFAPLYYLRLAWKIVTWDEASIHRASRDPNATYYGAALWALSAAILCSITFLPILLRVIRAQVWTAPMIVARLGIPLVFQLTYFAVITFVELGLCYLIAKWIFGGAGTYMGVMRPLLLGWWVNIAGVFFGPIGLLLGGLAWTAVVMLVFEEVAAIPRLKAFLIGVSINVGFIALQLWLAGLRRHG